MLSWLISSFVTLAFVFAWHLAHRIGRQGTTRSEVSWAAPGQPVHSSSQSHSHRYAHPLPRTLHGYAPSFACPFSRPRCLRSRHALQ
ncbi:hypothetical protein B0H13DRAFT_2170984, partial [Mycena leptocephala]